MKLLRRRRKMKKINLSKVLLGVVVGVVLSACTNPKTVNGVDTCAGHCEAPPVVVKPTPEPPVVVVPPVVKPPEEWNPDWKPPCHDSHTHIHPPGHDCPCSHPQPPVVVEPPVVVQPPVVHPPVVHPEFCVYQADWHLVSGAHIVNDPNNRGLKYAIASSEQTFSSGNTLYTWVSFRVDGIPSARYQVSVEVERGGGHEYQSSEKYRLVVDSTAGDIVEDIGNRNSETNFVHHKQDAGTFNVQQSSTFRIEHQGQGTGKAESLVPTKICFKKKI